MKKYTKNDFSQLETKDTYGNPQKDGSGIYISSDNKFTIVINYVNSSYIKTDKNEHIWLAMGKNGEFNTFELCLEELNKIFFYKIRPKVVYDKNLLSKILKQEKN